MKINAIRTAAYAHAPSYGGSAERDHAPSASSRKSWIEAGVPVASPMSRYPRFAGPRTGWLPTWRHFCCVVEAEDGSVGVAVGCQGRPVATVIEDYLGPRLVGEDALNIAGVYDMAVDLCAPFGASGLASFAISAIDLALWDLNGKLLERPVYDLLGGRVHQDLACYATGADTDWYRELGFDAVKLPCPHGPPHGASGLKRNVELVRRTRAELGDDVEIMLDCWMALDVDYTVRLAEALRPYNVRWLEECLRPGDLHGHRALRERLPWQTLATGEHWFTASPFQHAVSERLVDILQPDVQWVGGLTAVRRICELASSAGVTVILHGGGNTPYGQHASLGLGLPLTEVFIGSPPGVPLDEANDTPGMSVPRDGRMTPSSAPGFGLEVDVSRLEYEPAGSANRG